MHCRDVLELIEPIAAGDLLPDGEMRDHLQSCPQCAGALASARRVQTLLSAMEVPPAPATFTASVLQRIRRDKWRSEQNVDRLFNVAMVAAILLVVGGLAALLNVDGMLSFSGAVLVFLKDNTRETARTAVPAVVTYAAALGLLASALGMWWWADQRLQF